MYARLYNGRITVARDAATGLYLFADDFADDAPTIAQLLGLKAGDVRTVRLSGRHHLDTSFPLLRARVLRAA